MKRSTLAWALGGASLLALALGLALVRPAPDAPRPPIMPTATATATASASAAPAPLAPPTSEPAEPLSPACAALAEHNQDKLDSLESAGDGGEEAQTPAVLEGAAVLLRPCFPGPDGPWGLRLEAWTAGDPHAGVGTAKGTVRVLHRAAAGQGWVEASDTVGEFAVEAGLSYTSVETPATPDIEGDGAPELWFSMYAKDHEGGGSTVAHLLRFRGGAVERVPDLPDNYQELRDVDGDGRTDLLYYPYATSGEQPCTRFWFERDGPPFLAHARPDGSFSRDDDEAQRHARSLCPEGAVEVPDDDSRERADPLICARLRGASTAAALALLAKRCRALRPSDDPCSPPPGVCVDHAVRVEWTRREPPLRLR